MIIPLDKLISFDENRYLFTKAAMESVDKFENITVLFEDKESWKIVPNILKLLLDEKLKYQRFDEEEE